MMVVEMKSMDLKCTWQNIDIFRAPHEGMRVIARLVDRTGYSRNFPKRVIIGGDLNLAQADWNGSAEGTSGNQVFINRLLWEN
jgi:hypothetical protein